MKTATIVGAGIAGPVAALTLQKAGWDVTIREEKAANSPGSIHMITLESFSVDALKGLGLKEKDYQRYRKRIPISNGFLYDETLPPVMWDDLHKALLARCNVIYNSRVDYQPETDIVVWADGIGSYGRNSLTNRVGTYAGEMLFRGLSPRGDDDMTWYTVGGPVNRMGASWSMVSYATWDANDNPVRGWTLFLPIEREPWDNIETLSNSQVERLLRSSRSFLSSFALDLVERATEITAAPQILWPPIDGEMLIVNGAQRNYLIGDAAGTVSPRTGMGANIGIMEAAKLTIPSYQWDMEFTQAADDLFTQSRQYVGEYTGIHG